MKYLMLMLLSFFSHFAFCNFQVEIITSSLNKPWGMAQLPDGRFLVTEKSGKLRIVNLQGDISSPMLGLPTVSEVGQGGLLDVVLHPNFSENKWVYFSYVSGSRAQGYGTEVMRAQLNGDQLSNQELIFTALPKVSGGRHFGSRLLFDREGYLYISLGDRGRRDQAQNLSSHLGSLIRLHDDGTVPKDNPFVSIPNVKPEIYSYGHRNIQGLALQPESGLVWAHEHGPQGGDEINLLKKGKNYGWPVITYGAEYVTGFKIGEGVKKAGMEQPVYYWNPSIAPSGMTFFKNDLFVGALKYQLLAQLQIDDKAIVNEKRLFESEFGRIRDVKAFDDERLYLLTDARQGKLIRLTYSPSNVKKK